MEVLGDERTRWGWLGVRLGQVRLECLIYRYLPQVVLTITSTKWFFLLFLTKCHSRDTPNTGPDKVYRKIPWDFLRGKTPKFRGMCRYYFSAPPNIFHNFVSFHLILMFFTNLESGDKNNNIVDEFKTIRLIQINT